VTKLTIELIPQTSFFKNLRQILSAKEWRELKTTIYKKANYKCEICNGIGTKHPVECHEIWNYNEKEARQTLIGLIALCPKCHMVKHYGFHQMQGRGKIAKLHMASINNWTTNQVDEHIQSAFKLWEQRNKINWKLDTSYITKDKK